MFTGIIEELGAIEAITPVGNGSRLRIRASVVTRDAQIGDSISVNGCCLTAVELTGSGFAADVSPETMRRTSLGALRPSSIVNLERALQAGARLGGHIVQGHVDATGAVESAETLGDGNYWLRVRYPAELDRYLVFKGSVAIDGISLTIAEIANGVLAVAAIPHTWKSTNLYTRKPGDVVNLETDVLAKYVEKMLGALDVKSARLTVDALREQGY